TSGQNINWISVVAGGAPAPTPTVTPAVTSSSASVSVATWNIQVDDSSDYHARLAIDLLMNMSPRPQIIQVEEARLSRLGSYLSELQAQTGQTWNAAYETHCPLGGWNGSWCTASEDEMVAI